MCCETTQFARSLVVKLIKFLSHFFQKVAKFLTQTNLPINQNLQILTDIIVSFFCSNVNNLLTNICACAKI